MSNPREIKLTEWSDAAPDVAAAAESILDDPRVKQTLFAGELRIDTADALKVWKQNIRARRLSFLATLDDPACCVGAAALERGNLSFFVAPDLWGQGIGTAIVHAMLTGPVADAAMSELYANVARENFASRRILQAVGFREIGIRAQTQGLTPLIEYRWTA